MRKGWRIDEFEAASSYVQCNFDTIVVAYSGGKDSTACLLWCNNTFPDKKVFGLLADTGIEAPGTKEYRERGAKNFQARITSRQPKQHQTLEIKTAADNQHHTQPMRPDH